MSGCGQGLAKADSEEIRRKAEAESMRSARHRVYDQDRVNHSVAQKLLRPFFFFADGIHITSFSF